MTMGYVICVYSIVGDAINDDDLIYADLMLDKNSVVDWILNNCDVKLPWVSNTEEYIEHVISPKGSGRFVGIGHDWHCKVEAI